MSDSTEELFQLPPDEAFDLFADDQHFQSPVSESKSRRAPTTAAGLPRFDGDTGTLPERACHAYQELLKREFVTARHVTWRDLLTYRAEIGSRLNELNLILVVNEDQGFAYKTDATVDGGYALLAKKPISMMDSLVLIHLRLQQAVTAPHEPTIVERADIVDSLRPYRNPEDTNEKRHDDKVLQSVEQLITYKLLSPIAATDRLLVEPVLAAAFPLTQIQALNEVYLARARGERVPAPPADGGGAEPGESSQGEDSP